MLQETVRVAFLSDSNAQLFCFGLDGFDGVLQNPKGELPLPKV